MLHRQRHRQLQLNMLKLMFRLLHHHQLRILAPKLHQEDKATCLCRKKQQGLAQYILKLLLHFRQIHYPKLHSAPRRHLRRLYFDLLTHLVYNYHYSLNH